ncbi:LysR family transcriptional regulator [Myxococcus stipitatus DSM 14675]|uniref:LysR family transcriptional regulator n=1 Tax=Myxococcus stipitatus (strain DSM 14675 / JCM 12634 / Mx s8) TaxID=1278073 RepID=L7U649_MYXSD|nr:LysR family transcriptional regulator [Myxococcus stipitatus]AGC44346.1 LysR family transcriptional regulator [Myxococcus stipitatus DSM 14675]
MDLNQLALFVTVAEGASFSTAAKKLGMPKSSVSRGIAQLESSLGVQLLHRTTRRVSLSTAGQSLYERVSPMLASLRKSVGELPELEDEPSGELRLTAVVDWGATLLADVVTRFVARYPAVKVDLHLDNRVVDLVAEGFDAALRLSLSPLKDSALRARRLGPLTLRLYASPGYLARRGTPRHPRELASHSWIAFRSEMPLRLAGPGDETSPVPRMGVIRCDDMFFMRETLRLGAGIGFLHSLLAEPEVTEGRLVPVLPKWSIAAGSVWFVSTAERHMPRKVAAFRDFLMDALKHRPLPP